MPFTIPSSVPEGKYIMRGELLTTYLPDTVSTAQGYIGCSALQVGSGSDNSASLPKLAGDDAVALPAAYQGASWIHYDLYSEWTNGNQPSNVPSAPGPAVWNGGGSGSGSSGTATASGSSTTPPSSMGRRKHRRSRHEDA